MAYNLFFATSRQTTMLRYLVRHLQFKKYPLRGKAAKAWAVAGATKDARWRYAIRHPEFMTDLRRLSQLYRRQSKRYMEVYSSVLKKWRFHFIEEQIFLMLPHLPNDRQARIELLEGHSDGVMAFPAFAHHTDDKGALLLEVDLNCPIDGLLPLIQEELREAKALYTEGTPRRRRPDKTDFQISVFDLADQNKSFPEIARALKRHVSTVKSAYLVAHRNIFGIDPANTRARSIEDLDPHSHTDSCPTCRKAQTFDELCMKAKRYAHMDYKSQRERPSGTEFSDSRP
jgi:hypothetical protein